MLGMRTAFRTLIPLLLVFMHAYHNEMKDNSCRLRDFYLPPHRLAELNVQ